MLRGGSEPGTKPNREVALLNFIRRNSSIAVPEPVNHDFGSDSQLQSPYVIQHRILGQDLDKHWNNLAQAQRCIVAKVVGQTIKALLSMESSVAGVLEASNINEHESVVEFEVEGEDDGDMLSNQSPRAAQTTYDFLKMRFNRWRATSYDETSDEQSNQVLLLDRLLALIEDMNSMKVLPIDLTASAT